MHLNLHSRVTNQFSKYKNLLGLSLKYVTFLTISHFSLIFFLFSRSFRATTIKDFILQDAQERKMIQYLAFQ